MSGRRSHVPDGGKPDVYIQVWAAKCHESASRPILLNSVNIVVIEGKSGVVYPRSSRQQQALMESAAEKGANRLLPVRWVRFSAGNSQNGNSWFRDGIVSA
jgi:hypothetical protein